MGEPADGAGVERVGGDGGGAEEAAVDCGQGGGEVDAPCFVANLGNLVGTAPGCSTTHCFDIPCRHAMGLECLGQEH